MLRGSPRCRPVISPCPENLPLPRIVCSRLLCSAGVYVVPPVGPKVTATALTPIQQRTTWTDIGDCDDPPSLQKQRARINPCDRARGPVRAAWRRCPSGTPQSSSLPFANGYLITGNYFVGSVDLPSTGGGSVDRQIVIDDLKLDGQGGPGRLPVLGDDRVESFSAPGVKFRGQTIDLNNAEVVKEAAQTLGTNTAACFSSGGGQGAVTRCIDARRCSQVAASPIRRKRQTDWKAPRQQERPAEQQKDRPGDRSTH